MLDACRDMSRVHQTGPGAQCYLADLADMAVQSLVHSAIFRQLGADAGGNTHTPSHTKSHQILPNLWTQEITRAVADKQVCYGVLR